MTNMIIDSHLHLNRLGSEPDFTQALVRLAAVLDKNQVDKAVIIADDAKNGTCIDTWHALSATDNETRYYIIGSPNVQNIDEGDWDFFEKNIADKKLIGLKLFPGHESYYPTDPICTKVYGLASKYDVPVMFHTGANSGDMDCAKYNDPKYIVEVAKKYPNVKFIISHYFWPKIEYCYDLTHEIPNIYYDTSAMADEEVVEMSGGEGKIKNILERTIADKPYSVMFGSDYDMCSQDKHIKLIQELNISDNAKNDIFCNNFLECFGQHI